MDLEQLQALVTVVDNRCITKAARNLHMSQPALSIKLKQLEQQLGAPLLVRSFEGVTPTLQGEMVYETARRVLELCDNMMVNLRSGQQRAELAFGSTPTLGGYVLPHVLRRFMVVEPDVRVHLSVLNLTGTVQQVEDGRLCVGFVEGPQSIAGLISEDVGEDELRLVAAANWQRGEDLNEDRALRLPHLLCVPECGMRVVLERYLQGRGRSTGDLQVVAELDHIDAVKALVEGGAGVAWLSPKAVQRELQAGTLRVLPVAGMRIPFTYVALHRRDRVLCPDGKRFVGLVRERLRSHRRAASMAEV